MDFTCTACGFAKSSEDYYWSKGYRKRSCKACVILADAERRRCRRDDPAALTARAVVRRRADARYKYGLTPDQYAQLVLEAEGRCRICQREADLQVDHCHATGRVRGMLCHRCNKALGLFMDDPVTVRSALTYLEAS